VCFLRRGELVAARAAFLEALARVPQHPLAMVGMEIVGRPGGGKAGRRLEDGEAERLEARERGSMEGDGTVGAALVTVRDAEPPAASLRFEREMARAALLVDAGDVPGAVAILLAALRN